MSEQQTAPEEVVQKLKCFFCHKESEKVSYLKTKFGFLANQCPSCFRQHGELISEATPLESAPEDQPGPMIAEEEDTEVLQTKPYGSEATQLLASVFNRIQPVFQEVDLIAISDRQIYLENVIKAIRQEIYALGLVKEEKIRKATRKERDDLIEHDKKIRARKVVDPDRERAKKILEAKKKGSGATKIANERYLTKKAKDLYIALSKLGFSDEAIDKKIKELKLT